MIVTRSTHAPTKEERIATWKPLYRAFRNRFAGLDHSGAPLPSRPSPAPSTPTPASPAKEFGPLSEGEQYAADACAD